MLQRVNGFMAFDPNYTLMTQTKTRTQMGDASDYDDERRYDDYDDYGGDDDDNTWKVRRASVRLSRHSLFAP